MKLKKMLALLAVACIAAVSLAGCGGKKKLVVSLNAEFKPWEYIDDDKNIVGADVDLMKMIGEKLGMEVEFQNTEFDGVIAAVTSGTCDAACSGLTINPGREKSLDFSTPYYTGAAQILIVRKDDTVFTGTTKEELDQQLKNKKIGVCTSFTGQFYAEGSEDWGFEKIEGATVKVYENVSLAAEDLKNGQIEVIIMDDSVAKETVSANAETLKIIDVALTVEKYGIGVKKGDTEMLEKINKALKELEDSGELKKLLEKWNV